MIFWETACLNLRGPPLIVKPEIMNINDQALAQHKIDKTSTLEIAFLKPRIPQNENHKLQIKKRRTQEIF